MQRKTDEATRAGIVARLWAAFGVFGMFWGGWGALLPDVQKQVGASDATLGRALLFIALGAIGGMLLAGRVCRPPRGTRRSFPERSCLQRPSLC